MTKYNEDIKDSLIKWLKQQHERQYDTYVISLGIPKHKVDLDIQKSIAIYFAGLIITDIPINNWPTIKQIKYADQLLMDAGANTKLIEYKYSKAEEDILFRHPLTKDSIGDLIHK